MAPGSGSERGETGALNGPAADVSREELSIVELVRLDTRPLGSFSKDEQQLLDLYDCLQELRLERALLEVQRYDSEGTTHKGEAFLLNYLISGFRNGF